MATKIRLKRMGTTKRPYYRIVAIDSREAVKGSAIDILGQYSPMDKPGKISVNEEKAFHWLDTGAEPSDTVAALFAQIGLTRKYLTRKAGGDFSGMEVKSTITERPKKRKAKAKAE